MIERVMRTFSEAYLLIQYPMYTVQSTQVCSEQGTAIEYIIAVSTELRPHNLGLTDGATVQCSVIVR